MTLFRTYRPNYLSQSPFETMGRLHDELQRLLDGQSGASGSEFFSVWAPALDVYEDKDSVVVTLEVPGMKKEGFEIALHGGTLSIAGERHLDDQRRKVSGYRTERFEGRFQRSIALPKQVQTEKVAASYRDGILTVTLPIAEDARPKQITIKAD
jgi:HSP20 family protein